VTPVAVVEVFARSSSSFAFKGTHTKQRVFAHSQKVTVLPCYKKYLWGILS